MHVKKWILLHVIDPLAFSEVSKIHWPFKAVVIEGIYDEVSELEASQMTRRPRRVLIGLIYQSFKDGIFISDKVAKGIKLNLSYREASEVIPPEMVIKLMTEKICLKT